MIIWCCFATGRTERKRKKKKKKSHAETEKLPWSGCVVADDPEKARGATAEVFFSGPGEGDSSRATERRTTQSQGGEEGKWPPPHGRGCACALQSDCLWQWRWIKTAIPTVSLGSGGCDYKLNEVTNRVDVVRSLLDCGTWDWWWQRSDLGSSVGCCCVVVFYFFAVCV